LKIESILVVCVGNICRSPVGERLLARAVPNIRVSSAGLGALVGNPADATMSKVAARSGLSLDGHVARQFTPELAAENDLILVMEAGHRAEIIRTVPAVSGKTMLFDHWIGGKGVADPYRKPEEFHKAVFDQLALAVTEWTKRLGAGQNG
jgi:protein-tyrosine phosphatase